MRQIHRHHIETRCVDMIGVINIPDLLRKSERPENGTGYSAVTPWKSAPQFIHPVFRTVHHKPIQHSKQILYIKVIQLALDSFSVNDCSYNLCHTRPDDPAIEIVHPGFSIAQAIQLTYPKEIMHRRFAKLLTCPCDQGLQLRVNHIVGTEIEKQ